jgi:sulfatase maturation enzyme AslB (radical SAM superfamily)
MIANYGFEDGSGAYYISIDTDKCSKCEGRGCINGGCPAEIFELQVDDWDNEMAVVKKDVCNKIVFLCSECKPISGRKELLPCQSACSLRAIVHSW